ncbi:MAG TPA: Hsp33 family molecular chaperone HslO [Bacillota bacterium]|nr:Hsp33 family molecular chaperone HslO [Bacillota bacterium]
MSKEKDYIVRAISRDGKVRAFAIQSTQIVENLRKRNDTWPVASAALGRTASAAAMMGAMLKGKERLSIQIKGGGPIGQIIVDANALGEVRGIVTHPHIHFPLNDKGKLDVARAVGTDGFLRVTKDLGLKEPYVGSIELISGELGEDFTYYFAASEQTPSAVGVGVLVNEDYSIRAAGGFIIQLLPGIKDSDIDEIEKKLSQIKPVSTMIDQGMTPEEILCDILGEEDIEFLGTLEVVFSCHCSEERVEKALITLGEDELKDMLTEGDTEITCHFCNEKYEVKKAQLEKLIQLVKK